MEKKTRIAHYEALFDSEIKQGSKSLRNVLDEFEAYILQRTLQMFDGNATRAGEHIGLLRTTMLSRMNKVGIESPRQVEMQKNKAAAKALYEHR